MNNRTSWYIALSTVLGVCSASVLYYVDPQLPPGVFGPVVLLSILGLVAEALAVLHPNSVIGSIGFIPYLALALIVPHWVALLGVTIVRFVVEVLSKRAAGTAIFNVAQQATTFALSVIVFRLAGGQSLAELRGASVAEITVEIGLPALASFLVSFAINATLVAGFVAARSKRTVVEILRATHISTIGIDLLASPIVFLFAWAYVAWGPYAAVALWVPVLGLRQLQKNNLDLERSNSELLELMVKSMEARDPYTSGHSRRVQQFSLAIARGLALSPTEIDRVGRAALLHDVGKIYEKYAPILRKPGKLSADEWQTMQQHPVDGAALVGTMSRLRDIIPAIRHHHERWDGTGYPDGLAGESIPLVSRIIAFADTIDAMVSERPYRRIMTENEVRAEVVRCRGTQFDPSITDKVLSSPIWRLLFAPEPATAPDGVLTLFASGERHRAKGA